MTCVLTRLALARIFLIAATFFVATSARAFPPGQATGQERLVLIGGGKRPPEALDLLIEWANEYRTVSGVRADVATKLLVVTWASEIPDEVAEAISGDLKKRGHSDFVYSKRPPESAAEIDEFLKALDETDGIFFSGGDQKRVMGFLKKHPEVYARIQAKYRAGLPMAGTSAGTAMQSKTMISGDIPKGGKLPPIDDGLGFLPDDVIVDQHFLERGRWKRLVPLVASKPGSMGIGVQEGGVISVRGGTQIQVLNEQPLFFVDSLSLKNGSPEFFVLEKGDLLDLSTRKFRRLSGAKCVYLRMFELLYKNKPFPFKK